jgi:hypothetical protein
MLYEIQNPATKANGTSANIVGFSKLKLGIGSTHPTVPVGLFDQEQDGETVTGEEMRNVLHRDAQSHSGLPKACQAPKSKIFLFTGILICGNNPAVLHPSGGTLRIVT